MIEISSKKERNTRKMASPDIVSIIISGLGVGFIAGYVPFLESLKNLLISFMTIIPNTHLLLRY